MAKNPDLYKKRYKTLKEHRAAVAARKALGGGKNKGPVANAAAYGETLKKPTAKTKPIPKTSKTSSSSAGKDRFFAGAKGGKFDKAVQNKEKAKSNFFRSSSGTRGESLPSNPKLKSQPKKPVRKDFAPGRTGATEYAAALRKYNAAVTRIGKPTVKRNRRGRAV